MNFTDQNELHATFSGLRIADANWWRLFDVKLDMAVIEIEFMYRIDYKKIEMRTLQRIIQLFLKTHKFIFKRKHCCKQTINRLHLF